MYAKKQQQQPFIPCLEYSREFGKVFVIMLIIVYVDNFSEETTIVFFFSNQKCPRVVTTGTFGQSMKESQLQQQRLPMFTR